MQAVPREAGTITRTTKSVLLRARTESSIATSTAPNSSSLEQIPRPVPRQAQDQ